MKKMLFALAAMGLAAAFVPATAASITPPVATQAVETLVIPVTYYNRGYRRYGHYQGRRGYRSYGYRTYGYRGNGYRSYGYRNYGSGYGYRRGYGNRGGY